MPSVVSITGIDTLGALLWVIFNVTTSGNYTTAVGGDVLNFTSSGANPVVQDPAYIGMLAAVESSQLLQLDVWSQGGNLINQYVPNVVSTSPASGGKYKIGANSSFGTELGTGAYPADKIAGCAVFTRML